MSAAPPGSAEPSGEGLDRLSEEDKRHLGRLREGLLKDVDQYIKETRRVHAPPAVMLMSIIAIRLIRDIKQKRSSEIVLNLINQHKCYNYARLAVESYDETGDEIIRVSETADYVNDLESNSRLSEEPAENEQTDNQQPPTSKTTDKELNNREPSRTDVAKIFAMTDTRFLDADFVEAKRTSRFTQKFQHTIKRDDVLRNHGQLLDSITKGEWDDDELTDKVKAAITEQMVKVIPETMRIAMRIFATQKKCEQLKVWLDETNIDKTVYTWTEEKTVEGPPLWLPKVKQVTYAGLRSVIRSLGDTETAKILRRLVKELHTADKYADETIEHYADLMGQKYLAMQDREPTDKEKTPRRQLADQQDIINVQKTQIQMLETSAEEKGEAVQKLQNEVLKYADQTKLLQQQNSQLNEKLAAQNQTPNQQTDQQGENGKKRKAEEELLATVPYFRAIKRVLIDRLGSESQALLDFDEAMEGIGLQDNTREAEDKTSYTNDFPAKVLDCIQAMSKVIANLRPSSQRLWAEMLGEIGYEEVASEEE
ncbi:hypothetical protein PT974_09680 [Cladobotryum mycophilum]|uniref:Uncharacterized protein n=1 Tax=Cladobotryum mycophilum TaxID=491253 RepID=A0ABR0SHC4_9HYPO